MELRLLRDRDADERRVERQRDERTHRLAEQGAVDVHRDNGDTVGKRRMTSRRSSPSGTGRS